jgi:alkylation response protein AidB-like acyl-CoA dehydrogenase
MQALLTQDQELVAETAARLAKGGLTRSRALLDGAETVDGPTAELIAGWSGLGVPEAEGGAGGSAVEAALLVHALGEGAEPGAFPGHFHAVHALLGAGLAGELLGDGRTAALVDATGVAPDRSAALMVEYGGDRWILSEVAEWTPVRALDPARRAGRAMRGAVIAEGIDSRHGLSRIQVLLAAEACGVGRGAIRLASDYARTREQFGKPIGSYQAIGHRLAQATADIEAAWSLTLHAAWALGDAPELAVRSAHMAKAAAGDAAIFACEACVQTHGGMGITREADPHLYLKRAFSIDASWGRAAELNRRIGAALLAG